jgi:hypothetical protein
MDTLRNMRMEDYQKFTSEHLIGIDNLELLILKGHILVEYAINLYLEAISTSEQSDFFKENFTFSNKLSILKHFGNLGTKEDNLYQEIHLLNKLRNDIAHKLTFNEKHLQDFYSHMGNKSSRIMDGTYKTDREKFIGAIGFICGAIFTAYKYKTDKEDLDQFIAKERK